MTRIFLTSSHFSTVLMTAYARSSGQGNDFLIFDSGLRKQSNIQQMQMAAALHPWSGMFDFSEISGNEKTMLPGTAKKITRRLKNLPVFRPVYAMLLRNYQRKISQKKQEELHRLIGPVNEKGPVHLFLLKETVLNDALTGLFNNAVVSYFEHGLSDYLLVENDPPKGEGKFYCVFSDGFRNYLERKKTEASFVRSFADAGSFREICKSYFDHHPEQVSLLQSVCPNNKSYALIILQPFKNIQVDSHCWEGFLDKCINTAGQQEIHYILKPHPLQSRSEIEEVEYYFRSRRIAYTLAAENTSVISIELSFYIWQENMRYVFSPYSSAVFYLSRLFPREQTRYYFAYEYMRPFLHAAPANFYRLFNSAGLMIKEVFSENCTEI